MQEAGKKEVKIIKRYQNRKLYDTNQSCYVTLDEIAQMIRNGDDLRVIDNKSKLDITAITLTQLLYESERKTKNGIPVEMLKEIIRAGDGSFSGYIRNNLAAQLRKFDTENATSPDRPSVPTAINN
ncbi:MAG: polyhydroxyalkanoate synthesis regulator DNA-binding domain-containing protein [Bacteriovoracia bacterium]